MSFIWRLLGCACATWLQIAIATSSSHQYKYTKGHPSTTPVDTKLSRWSNILCSHIILILSKPSKVISGWLSICDNAHSWRFYSATPLGNQAISTMTWCPTHSHHPVTEPTSPCPILLMQSARLGSNKYRFYKSLLWLDQDVNPDFLHWQPAL